MVDDEGFEAQCPRCGEVTRFTVTERERHRIRGAERAAREADFALEHEWGFECTSCLKWVQEIRDVEGRVHRMSGRQHRTIEG